MIFSGHSNKEEFVARLLMIDDGLIPEHDSRKVWEHLKKMTPSRRREVSRKFRKAWRKVRKNIVLRRNYAMISGNAYKRAQVFRYYLEEAAKKIKEGDV